MNVSVHPVSTEAMQDHLARQVSEFVTVGADYYSKRLNRNASAAGNWTFNWAAALLGPVWAASRSLVPLFWLLLMLQLAAAIQIGIGASGNLGVSERARAERLANQAEAREKQAEAAVLAANPDAERIKKSATSLRKAAYVSRAQAEAARVQAPMLVGAGLVTLIVAIGAGGLLGNYALERRFTRWRSDRSLKHGLDLSTGIATALFCAGIYALAIYRFGSAAPVDWLAQAPSSQSWQIATSSILDGFVNSVATLGAGFFGTITKLISMFLDGFAYVLISMPWPITMAMILLLAYQVSGARLAIVAIGALAYLSVLGFWEHSLETIALLGTAATLSIAIGVPVGVWCGRHPSVYAAIRPLLDFMQTMPAFVYLIPVIALFGIGKPPGVIATVIFGTPPVVRLTALGIQGVPMAIREAATAFGATPWFLLTRVDLPLATPSIMTGVNQTILMCLSMVVIASLIGAKGLGEDVLVALQYAAVGQGLLAGFAILLCAIVLDRLVQGVRK